MNSQLQVSTESIIAQLFSAFIIAEEDCLRQNFNLYFKIFIGGSWFRTFSFLELN